MSNLVLKNKSSKKEIIIFISVFIIGLISRIGFGLFNTTGDLTWYVDPSLDEFGYPQLTRFGFHKEILFLPLQLFKSINLRIMILAFITSFLNTLSIFLITKNSNQKFTIYIGLLSILNIFFARIDMHLVRQQISIYFFIISISQNKLNIKSIIIALLSITYHEANLLFLSIWLAAKFIYKKSLNNLTNNLFISSLVVDIILYFLMLDRSIILMIFISIAIKLTKLESNKFPIYSTFYIFQILLLFLYFDLNFQKLLIPTELAITRLVGLGISYGFIILIANGVEDKRSNFKKKVALIIFISSYGLIKLLKLI